MLDPPEIEIIQSMGPQELSDLLDMLDGVGGEGVRLVGPPDKILCSPEDWVDTTPWDDGTADWAFADSQVAPREGETMEDVARNNQEKNKL